VNIQLQLDITVENIQLQLDNMITDIQLQLDNFPQNVQLQLDKQGVGNGGGYECGEEGWASRPFIGSEGKWGGRTGKGIGWLVVAASMPAIRFGGEGKQRGEWGNEEGGKCGTISERGGVHGVAAVCAIGGGGGRSGFKWKETAGRLIWQAHLSVRGRRRGRLG
jgi:hypothetical protein